MSAVAVVYILQSLTAPNRPYVGLTHDLHKRLDAHNAGLTGVATWADQPPPAQIQRRTVARYESNAGPKVSRSFDSSSGTMNH